MAVGMIFAPPKDVFSKETYSRVIEHLGSGFPPAAMSLHVMGTTDQGEVRIVDIFESAESFKEFAESHAPVYEEMGVSVDEVLKHVTLFEIDKKILK